MLRRVLHCWGVSAALLTLWSAFPRNVPAVEPAAVGWKEVGRVAPRHARQIEASNWSVGGETLDRDYAIYANYKAWLGPLGAKKIRFQAGWAKCEKQRGVYDWAWLDECVNDAVAQGVAPWLETSYGNTIYPDGGGTGLAGGLPRSPEALAAWDRWVDALVRRYKDRVCEWQVWNEPDIRLGGNSPEAYADLYIRTAEIIRRHQPHARMLALPLSGIRQTGYLEGFLQRLQSRGKLQLVDQMVVHAYPENPDLAYPVFDKLAAVVARYSKTIPLRQGESGAPSGKTVGALAKFNSSETIQAKWDLRRMLGDLGHDMESHVFTIVDFLYERAVHEGWNTKGLLQANPDKTVARPKLAYHAVQHVTAIFDHTLARIKTFQAMASGNDAVAAYAYVQPSGAPLVTLWLSGVVPGNSNATRPVDFTFPGLRFQEPVYVDLRDGRVYAVPAARWTQQVHGCRFTAVPIYDSPILLAERKLVPVR